MAAESNVREQSAPLAVPQSNTTTAKPSTPPTSASAQATNVSTLPGSNSQKKRKFDSNNRGRGRGRGRSGPSGRGIRGGRGGARGARGDGKRKDRDREEKEAKDGEDKSGRNNDWRELKRRKIDENGDGESYMSIPFSKDEIAAEERRPKRKVAVMIGYAGTGYHGMQINHKEKTIEGDIFAALVAANAISKANADDPRKSSLVRCARTDKGVHAAGNVISLKLIIEDPDVVKNINNALPRQIRVWGIQRTNNAFSCYQTCDSRWYEYLMPSYCLLPPHPESFMGKKVLESIKENGVEEEYAKRLADVKDFWEDVEKNDIRPILDGLSPEDREEVLRRLRVTEDESNEKPKAVEPTQEAKTKNQGDGEADRDVEMEYSNAGEQRDSQEETNMKTEGTAETRPTTKLTEYSVSAPEEVKNEDVEMQGTGEAEPASTLLQDAVSASEEQKPRVPTPADIAVKQIKAAYVAAKRRYRVTPERLTQLQEALNEYVGTKNFHNYTIQKAPNDPSAKRHIKSFMVNTNPIQINDTQWLSLKVHGQSFMMHQIRKMVGMAVLLTRCATPLSRIRESYSADRISIPKAPGLGLLLERPVFDAYNSRAKENFEKPPIDFGNYEKELQEFKDTQIYNRIFELEEKENSFHTFFHQIDNFKSDYFLWVTAGGIAAAHKRVGQTEEVPAGLKAGLEDEGEGEDPENGEG